MLLLNLVRGLQARHMASPPIDTKHFSSTETNRHQLTFDWESTCVRHTTHMLAYIMLIGAHCVVAVFICCFSKNNLSLRK